MTKTKIDTDTSHASVQGTISTQNTPITDIEAARRLGLAPKTLRSWRCRKRGPVFLKFGTAIRYRPSDLDDFIRQRTVDCSTALSRGDAQEVG
jgi:hypothetical protein